MLMDVAGALGISVMAYLVYRVWKVDGRLGALGLVGLIAIATAYVGRYVNIDKSVAVFAVLLVVVVVVGILLEKI